MVLKVAKAPTQVTRQPAVRVERVSKVYTTGRIEVRALSEVTLTVRSGEFMAIMGPSGSGKSTLLNLIAGLDAPSNGQIFVNGACLSSMNDGEATVFRRRHIGFIYQRFNFFPDLTIEENVSVPLMLDDHGGRSVAERVARVLQQVDLWERRHQLPAEVSGGELQRAAIARALVADPAVLLADEPTGNLDSTAGERVLLDMRRTVDDLGRTVILVTHNPIAAAYADRTETLRDGSFTTDGSS